MKYANQKAARTEGKIRWAARPTISEKYLWVELLSRCRENGNAVWFCCAAFDSSGCGGENLRVPVQISKN
jgi:hypothetical protein